MGEEKKKKKKVTTAEKYNGLSITMRSHNKRCILINCFCYCLDKIAKESVLHEIFRIV